MRTVTPLVLLALASPPAQAVPPEVPLLMSVHGRLLRGDDTPVDGSATLTFALYDVQEDPTGQTIPPLWKATFHVTAWKGEYAALLGDTGEDRPALPASFFNGSSPRWLGIKVNDDAEGRPRIPVTSVPYALIAGRAERAALADDADHLGGELPADFHDAAQLTGTLPPSVLGASAANIASVGTITSGTWEGTPIDDAHVAGAADWNAKLDAVAHDGSLTGSGDSGHPLKVKFGSTSGTAAAGDDARFGQLASDISGLASTTTSAINSAKADAVSQANAATDTKLQGYLNRNDAAATYLSQTDAANTYVAKSGGGLGVATIGANTAMNQNDALTVTHPADANRQVTVLVETPTAQTVFYVNAEDGLGRDAISNVTPAFYTLSTTAAVATQGKFGSKSISANDYPAWAYWTLPSGTLNFGTGDFTVRLWLKTGQGYIGGGYWANFIGNYADNPSAVTETWDLGLLSLTGMRYLRDGTIRFDQAITSFHYAAGQWYHLAFERYAGNIYWYVDGQLRGSTFADANAVGSNNRNTLYLGCLLDWDNVPDMYFDDIEVIKGAIYKGVNFTPPTASGAYSGGPGTGTFQAIYDGARFRVEYINNTTTKVTKLSAGAESVRVIVRTFQ